MSRPRLAMPPTVTEQAVRRAHQRGPSLAMAVSLGFLEVGRDSCAAMEHTTATARRALERMGARLDGCWQELKRESPALDSIFWEQYRATMREVEAVTKAAWPRDDWGLDEVAGYLLAALVLVTDCGNLLAQGRARRPWRLLDQALSAYWALLARHCQDPERSERLGYLAGVAMSEHVIPASRRTYQTKLRPWPAEAVLAEVRELAA